MAKSAVNFDVKDYDVAGRLGVFKVGNRSMDTPNIFPVVSPFENAIPPRRMFDHFKVQALFTNAYIIYQKQINATQIIEKGLHSALDFPGIIATDSGGFQDYMYGGDLKINPEEIEPFQEQIGADCPVILDIPVQITDPYEKAKEKVETTLQRAKNNINRRKRLDTAWFGPIHGSIHSNLLEYSTKEMSDLDFGIYAIGGVVKTFIDYRFDLDVNILLQVKQWVNPNRPLHMFGLGLPSFFSLAVACGADTFDSAAYYLYAADNRYFTLQGTKSLDDLTELPCQCPVCIGYNVKEIRQLSQKDRTRVLSEHNLYLSLAEMRTIRQAIRDGNLWELVEQRTMAHPKLIKALQVTRNYLPLLEQFTPTEKVRGIKYLSDNSFYRPEVYRYLTKIQSYRFNSEKNHVIILPELDIPTHSSPQMLNWLKSLQIIPSNYQILLLSNLFGPIPLELKEFYPISQHDGFPILESSSNITFQLISIVDSLLTHQSPPIKTIYLLIPDSYVNEFDEHASFSKETHLITHLFNKLMQNRSKLSKFQVCTFNTIEALLQEISH